MQKRQHRLTAVERRRGQAAGAATKRRRRAEAEQRAVDAVDSALRKLEQLAPLERLLESEDDHVVFRAVHEILDRVLGRPRQQVDVGWPKTFMPDKLTDAELEQMHTLLLKAQPDPNDDA